MMCHHFKREKQQLKNSNYLEQNLWYIVEYMQIPNVKSEWFIAAMLQ